MLFKMEGGRVYLYFLCLYFLQFTSIGGVPGIPGRPIVVDITTSSVLLEFKAANESVDTYQVEFSQAPSLSYTDGVKIGIGHGEPVYRITQTGLIPGAYYKLRVVPRITLRTSTRGLPSEIVEVQIALPAIIEQPTITKLTTSSAMLEFLPANGSVSLYRVEYTLVTSHTYTQGATLEANTQERYRIQENDLIPGETYHVRIIPYVALGLGGQKKYYRGIPSEPVEAIIPKPAIPGTPTLIKVTTSSAILEFMAANGSVYSYKSEYAPTLNLKYVNGSTILSQIGHTIYRITTPLAPGMDYHMHIVPTVRVGTSYYRGIPSESVQVSSPPLERPDMPTVIAVTTSSVLLEFSATNDSKSAYQIEYTSTSYPFTKGPSVGVVMGSLMYTVKLSYLVPGKHYNIRVFSIVTVGLTQHRGLPSPAVEVQIPKPVIENKPLIRRISEGSAEVLFFPSNGSSTHYRIQYKRGRDYDHVGFHNGILLHDDGRASSSKYMVLQTGLTGNTEYVLRVVPLVYISRQYYPGIASPAGTASAHVQGQTSTAIPSTSPATTSPSTTTRPTTIYMLTTTTTEPPMLVKIDQPRVVRLTTSSVTLDFAAANGSVSSYQVEYAPSLNPHDVENIVINGIDGKLRYRVEITHLIPGTQYRIRVVPQVPVENSQLRTLPSDYTTVTIPKPVSPAMPTIISVTTSTILLQFPATNDSKSAYSVEYGESRTLDFRSGVLVRDVNGKAVYRALQTNLIPGTHYSIRIVPIVTLFSKNYRGHPSASIEVQTYKPVMIKAPKLRIVSPSSVEVQFLPSNGSSTHYGVQHKVAGFYDDVPYSHGPLVTDDGRTPTEPYTVLQSGLLENTEYVFRVLPMVKINAVYYPGTPSPTASTAGQAPATDDESTINTDDQPMASTTDSSPNNMTTTIALIVVLIIVIIALLILVIIHVWGKRRRNHTATRPRTDQQVFQQHTIVLDGDSSMAYGHSTESSTDAPPQYAELATFTSNQPRYLSNELKQTPLDV